MKLNEVLTLVAIAATLALVAAKAIATESNPLTRQDARLVLEDGRKWKTDEAIRRGMESIREQVAAVRASSRLAPLQPVYYAALGDSIKREVRAMHAGSSLGPQADASFHVVVNQLLIAAHTLEGQTTSAPDAGMDHAELIFARYALFFDHPGWNA